MGLNKKRNPTYVTENSRLKFGKHNGTKVKEVLDFDPGWLDWAFTGGVLIALPALMAKASAAAADESQYDYDIGDMPY